MVGGHKPLALPNHSCLSLVFFLQLSNCYWILDGRLRFISAPFQNCHMALIISDTHERVHLYGAINPLYTTVKFIISPYYIP